VKHLAALIDELEAFAPHANVVNTVVSKGAVGWHIEHSLLTVRKIVEFAASTDPNTYRGVFKPARIFVLGLGIIPRGKVKSPQSVTPDFLPDTAMLSGSIAAARNSLSTLLQLQANQYFTHPVLGVLNKKPTERFLQVHTEHHLKIIREIMAAGKVA
jgi:hypothetical protein